MVEERNVSTTKIFERTVMRKLQKIIERKPICIFFFNGWDNIQFGFHINWRIPNIEIHVPFGFFKIGWQALHETWPANTSEQSTFGYKQEFDYFKKKREINNPNLKECGCISAFQDEEYGRGLRIHNKTKTGYRCTVCQKEKQ